MTVSSVTALPVLPLRDIVVFPHMIVPLFVGREKSIKALEAVMAEDKQIILATQTEAGIEDPDGDGLYTTGTVGSILQLLKLPDGAVKVLVEGGERLRLRLDTLTDDNGYLFVEAEPADQTGDRGADTAALSRATVQQFEQYIKLNKKIASEVLNAVEQVDEADKIADMIASHLAVKIAEKQDLLETLDVHERLEKILGVMEGEIGALQVEKRVRNRVKRQMEKTQREYYLNEQMKAIQKELGEGEDGMNELDEIEAQLNEMKLPKLVREKAAAELKKLRNMGPMSAEATVVRNYLDWIVALPWKKASRLKKDIVAARAVLDADHYGLVKVKDRIVEFLAVQQRTKAMRGPILCLVGPPGVGKTSLGKSIAKATGRQYVRMALGGVRDEAEIRGHRRTYIGSMPGKVLQGMKKAGMNNPLFLLDEVDKLGADWRGDPTSALLEVLDPAQNNAFQDHYMEVDFDLSNVMFVTTANTLNMPQPLMDRMEIIRLSGYTEDEKLEIAKRHLMKKQLDDHGLKDGELTISDDAVRSIIRLYTREAGVRNLEREIAKIARKTVTAIVSGKETSVTVTPDNIEDYLGVIRFRFGEMEDHDQIGVSTGLAWTEVGGELLNIEAVKVPGKGKVSATGKLGDVMKESIQAAEFFIKSRAQIYGIDLADLAKHDVHVHVPEGATPKDGPSAGVAMATSIISAITGIAIRRDVAMTGEITLRGRVLPIGGLKEKLLAAQRGGLKTVLIPKENEKDLADIPDNVKGALEIVPVAMVDEALSAALVREPVPTALEPT
ncbi:endopeptidase La, partial [Alphaproteobacteria bacterium]|nr:endopeptidase La [Alphaproteobacteria bacterium]